MTIKDALPIFISISAICAAIFIIPLMAYVIFPFVNSLSPEKRLEKFIDEKCLQGNEVAICIRRDRIRYYSDRDCKLIRAAIEGNVYAIRALKLELKEKYNVANQTRETNP